MMGKTSYPWPKCMADQRARYGSEEVARKVCGSIRARSQGLGRYKNPPVAMGMTPTDSLIMENLPRAVIAVAVLYGGFLLLQGR